MARISKVQAEMNMKASKDTSNIIKEEIELEKEVAIPDVSINKVETFNNEVAPTNEVYDGMRMLYEDKIQSMRNAVRILPPNMIKNGRHIKENIQAICGFMVTPEMLDEVYKDFSHEEY